MTTAVRPGNGKTWDQVFSGYPEKTPAWSLINSYLEQYAILARFGNNTLPHDFIQNKWSDDDECTRCDKPKSEHPFELSLDEEVMLINYRGWKESVVNNDHSEFNEFDPIAFLNALDDDVADSNAWSIEKIGLWVYFLVKIGAVNPTVGHFVGKGFEQNAKDADEFLGVK